MPTRIESRKIFRLEIITVGVLKVGGIFVHKGDGGEF
jgi:hypothetical protein